MNSDKSYTMCFCFNLLALLLCSAAVSAYYAVGRDRSTYEYLLSFACIYPCLMRPTQYALLNMLRIVLGSFAFGNIASLLMLPLCCFTFDSLATFYANLEIFTFYILCCMAANMVALAIYSLFSNMPVPFWLALLIFLPTYIGLYICISYDFYTKEISHSIMTVQLCVFYFSYLLNLRMWALYDVTDKSWTSILTSFYRSSSGIYTYVEAKFHRKKGGLYCPNCPK